LTGEAARRHLDEQDRRLKAIAASLKVAPAEAAARVEALVEERRKLERELTETRKKLALGGGSGPGAGQGAETVNGIGFLGRVVNGVGARDLKPLADEARTSLGSGVAVFVSTDDEGKASVVVGLTPDLVGRFSAVDLVRVASEVLGGKGGGGRLDMAQAGGPDGARGADAIEAVRKALAA
jgi:alanyl-tRNA synthetase